MIDNKVIAGYITFIDSTLQTSKIPFFKGQNTIGRSAAKSSVVINDGSISQKHAKLIVTDQKMIIIDLDSKNGIRINSQTNLIQKNKEFVIDEQMIIYLAEAKCKFQLIKQAPKKQVQKNKSKQLIQKKSKNLFSFDEDDDDSPIKNKVEVSKKSIENVPLPKKQQKPQQQKAKNLKINEATKQSDNASDVALQKNVGKIGKNNIQKKDNSASSINNSKGNSRQKVDKKLNVIKETVYNKEIIDDQQSDQQKITKQKDIKPKKDKKDKKVEKEPQEQQKIKPKQEEKVRPSQEDKKKKGTKKQEKKVQVSDQKAYLNKKSMPKDGKSKQEKEQKIVEHKNHSKDLKVPKNTKEQRQQSAQTKNQKKGSKQRQKSKKNNVSIILSNPVAVKQSKQSHDDDQQQNKTKAKTKRYTKRKPSQSLQKMAGIIPRRSQKANKRILASGFDLSLSKKYFLVVQSIDDNYDYLIMKNYVRTFKALFSICKGIMIIRNQWIKDSQFLEKTLDSNDYLFDQIDHVYDAIQRAKKGQKIFNGLSFYLASKEYHIKKAEIQILIVACGGNLISKVNQKGGKDKIAIVKNFDKQQEVKDDIKQAKALGYTKIYSIQMIMESCQRQKIDWKMNDLSK